VVLRLGSQPPKSQRVIYARSGFRVPCEEPPPLAPAKMKINADELMGWHGRIELRSLSNYPYNCVGMIFASRREWIEIDYAYDLLREDGYRQIPLDQVMIGDVVLYKDDRGQPSHVGIIIVKHAWNLTTDIKVMSKWGRDSEFIHFIEDVNPNLGRASEYYTDRVWI